MYKQGMFRHQKMAEIFHRNALSYEQYRRDRKKFLDSHTYFDPYRGNPLGVIQHDSTKERIVAAGRVHSYIKVPPKK